MNIKRIVVLPIAIPLLLILLILYSLFKGLVFIIDETVAIIDDWLL